MTLGQPSLARFPPQQRGATLLTRRTEGCSSQTRPCYLAALTKFCAQPLGFPVIGPRCPQNCCAQVTLSFGCVPNRVCTRIEILYLLQLMLLWRHCVVEAVGRLTCASLFCVMVRLCDVCAKYIPSGQAQPCSLESSIPAFFLEPHGYRSTLVNSKLRAFRGIPLKHLVCPHAGQRY